MLLDSNIIIYSSQPHYPALNAYLELNASTLVVSAVSKVEVLGFHKLTAMERAGLEEFFNSTRSYPVSPAVIDQATFLRQQRKLSLGDALIAATCLLYSESLLMNNEADFASIPNLTVIPMRTVI